MTHKTKNFISKINITRSYFWISLFIASILFSTTSGQLGTVLSSAIIVMQGLSVMYENTFMNIATRITPVVYAVLLFWCYMMVVSLLNQNINLLGLLKVSSLCIFLILANVVTYQKNHISFIKMTIIISSIVWGLVALTAVLKEPNRYHHGNITIFDASFDPNYVGIIFICGAILSLNWAIELKSVSFAIIFLLNISVIVATSSRGSFVSFGISVLFLIGKKLKKPKKMKLSSSFRLAFILFLVIIMFQMIIKIFPEGFKRIVNLFDGSGGSGRIEIWRGALGFWKNRPILGQGLNSYYYHSRKTVHNTYIQILCDWGIVGFSFFTLLIIKKLVFSFKSDYELFLVALPVFISYFFLDGFTEKGFWIGLALISLPRKTKEGNRTLSNSKTMLKITQ